MVTNPKSLLFALLTEMYCAGFGNSQFGAHAESVVHKLAHLSDQCHCEKKVSR